MDINQHLAHLSSLMAPPYTYHWSGYVKERAEEIAAKDATCAELPALVHAEFQRLKESSAKDESATSNMRPDEPPQMG